MKKPVLTLLALLALLAPSMAQTPPVAEPASNPAVTPAPDTAAEFLATLSDGQTLDDLAPAPLFLTGCASPCPTGQLCCYMCGNPPDGDDSFCWTCVTPVRGRCPLVV